MGILLQPPQLVSVCVFKFCIGVTNCQWEGFCLGQSEQMRKMIYQTQKGQTAEFESVILISVNQGRINHVSLSADQLQLFVAVLGGTLLTYNVHDIVQQVCGKGRN